MIEFFYEGDFRLKGAKDYAHWVSRVINSEDFMVGDINYIFCDDPYLLELNQRHLNHRTLTDIITFDYSQGKILSADIFISTERVLENSAIYGTNFQDELLRVMAHGILHLAGYNDKTVKEIDVMRSKEKEKIKLFHVEQM
ncbi:MAG: rRNA maturation RNase YbeY [Maribacter sp.]|nr:rRNA maturation RNase YbeY [Maribacter sp.]